MIFANLNKKINIKINHIKKGYKKIGLKLLFKKAFYQKTEEIFSEINLNNKINIAHKDVVEIHRMGKKDINILLEKYKQSCFYDHDPTNHIKTYFKNGCNCYIATVNRNIIGHIWWGDNQMRFEFNDPDLLFIRDEIKMKDEDVYMWDFYILPEKRPGGYAIEFFSKVIIDLKSLGYNRIIGFVPNIPSFRAAMWVYRLMGSKEIKRIIHRRILSCLVFKNNKLYFDKNIIYWLFYVDEEANP